MIMAGLWFTGKKPFHHIYITGMIKDELGRIMTKSLGNGIDPLEMVEKYGADAVRYSLVALSTEGQDIKLSQSKFEMGRNFANKIWNAYRFLLLNNSEITEIHSSNTEASDDLADKWIVSRLNTVHRDVETYFANYKLNEALISIYNFVWHDFCDWYIEILKDRLNSKSPGAPYALQHIALPTFKKAMELLHPVMPFITEEIWQHIGDNKDSSIMITNLGAYSEEKIDTQSENEMALLQQIIYVVRNIRGEMNVPIEKRAHLLIKCTHNEKIEIIRRNSNYLKNLCRLESVQIGAEISKPKQSAAAVISNIEIYMPLADLINIDREFERLNNEITRIQNQIQSISVKLSNREFIEKAPPEVVEREKKKLESFTESLTKLQSNLQALEK
jgi:valyl-tRNA synthetase